jgi:hypothetical protein
VTSQEIQAEIAALEDLDLDDCDPKSVPTLLSKIHGYALWEIALQLAIRNEAESLLVGRDTPHEAAKPTEANIKP